MNGDEAGSVTLWGENIGTGVPSLELPPPGPVPRRRNAVGIAIAAVIVVAAVVVGYAVFGPSKTVASGVASKVDPGVVDITAIMADQSVEALGTGVVLSATGEVLTNNHVIEGAGTITVRDVGNGKSYRAAVLGTDVMDDLALLQLKGASNLATVPLGTSSKPSIGETVFAIGNAGGTGGTPSVATGVIEALNRPIVARDDLTGSSEQLTGLIQTDAPLEPGDSGGPLSDRSAQVIGIDTAASTAYSFQSGSEEGFAIPISTALAVAHQIEAGSGSQAVHIGPSAFLGVEVQSAPFVVGAFVAGVVSGSPAQRAGLVGGDVIVSLGQKSVASPSDLIQIMQGYHPGDVVQVGWVDQSGTNHTAKIRLVTGPPQ